MRRAIECAVALAALASCGRHGSSQRDRPEPDDTVSVGYGTQSQKSVTGAVTSISPTDAETRVARVEELLQARVPGLQVLRLTNGDYTLRIRGQRGLRGGGPDEEPLLIIDDVIVPSGSLGAALAALAPRDIARIDVLKDAAATAIYGARGANGVIIIKTRRAP
jgi:TonB-dependent SusC/RagA subfamily outer membrane receptor